MEGVRPFFEAYARAFADYDADAIAERYVLPCLFVRDGATVAVVEADGLAASIADLLALHRAWDVQRVRPDEVAVLEETPSHAVARVDWRLGRATSRLKWSFSTTYTLVPADPDSAGLGWRVAVAVTHDAPF